MTIIVSVGIDARANRPGVISASRARVIVVGNSETTGGLRIFPICVVGGLGASAAIEPLVTAARGIVVGWGGAKSLLALVVTTKPELHECADEKEEGSEDRNGESCGVQVASKAEGDGVFDCRVTGESVGI